MASVNQIDKLIKVLSDNKDNDQQTPSSNINNTSNPLPNNILKPPAIKETFVPLSSFSYHKFEIPTKRISYPNHIAIFLKSETHRKLIKFLKDLSDSVKEKKISFNCKISSTTEKFIKMLSILNKYVDDIAPLKSATRYGNKAYRLWLDKLTLNSKQLIKDILPNKWIESATNVSDVDNDNDDDDDDDDAINVNKSILDNMINELNGYLLGSFGDYSRIDYGTGHELTFICFILMLVEIKVFKPTDFAAIILKIFNNYILLMRKIQIKYALEPAGTKGVWGLDDYQYLSFYFGAGQLVNNTFIKPSDILDDKLRTANDNDSEYLYLSCISFILKVKTGQFAEHSPLLHDISGVPFWYKVKNGLLKMYQDDVLKKLPIMQHFLFGSYLSIDLPAITADAKDNEKAQILKRKQALIAKLNAKNPNYGKTTKKNNDNAKPVVMTSAPWVTQPVNNPMDPMVAPPTAVPLANKPISDNNATTKAPWAK